ADIGGRILLLAAHAQHAGAIRVFEVDGEVIIDVAVDRRNPLLPAAHANRTHRVPIQRPVRHVNVVDVLLYHVIAGAVRVVEPVPEVMLHVRPSRLAIDVPEGTLIPIHLSGHNLADRAIVDAPHGLKILAFVPPLRAGDDGKSLTIHFIGQVQEDPRSDGIHGDGLLHEYVPALLDGIGHVDGAKYRRCREDDDIHITVDDLPEVIPSHELLLCRHLVGIAELLLELLLG